jgi:outer membrane lipase/esterase
LLAGANDILQGLPAAIPGGQAAISALGVTSAESVAGVLNPISDMNLLIGAGARTILVSNLPNLGATPQSIAGGVAAQQGGLLVATSFNTALNTNLQTLAAQNATVNIVQMDLYSAFNVIAANPGAFGFANITSKCLNAANTAVSAACAAAGGPDRFLFWDDIHPTARGHELIAQYATLLLSTEETGLAFAQLGQVALATRLEASDILFRRGAAPGAEKPGGIYAEVIGTTGNTAGTRSWLYGNTEADYTLGGVRGGFDASSGPVSFGAAVAYQSGNIDSRAIKADIFTAQLDAYALARFGPMFAGIEGGVSFNDYQDIRRNAGFPTVVGKGGTGGTDFSGAVTLGTQFQFGGITVTPAARVGYASINVDGYTESAPLLALQYGDREITTGFWTARVRAATPFFGFNRATLYGEVGYEDLFSTEGSYTAKLAFNTAKGVTLSPDDLYGRGLFLKAGVGGYLMEGVKLSGEYTFATDHGDGESHSGRLRLTIPLYGGAISAE